MIARPFHAASTLSSVPGRTRRARAASSLARSSASCASSSVELRGGDPRQHRRGVLEVAGIGHAVRVIEAPARPPGRARRFSCGGRPHVELALLALAVGVERRPQPAVAIGQLALEERDGLHEDLARRASLARHREHRGVDAEQLGLVVQHLLEVRHQPLRVDRVAREPAAEMVVDAALGHAARPLDGTRSRAASPNGNRLGPRQQLVARARRELRRAAEPAVLRIAALGELLARPR